MLPAPRLPPIAGKPGFARRFAPHEPLLLPQAVLQIGAATALLECNGSPRHGVWMIQTLAVPATAQDIRSLHTARRIPSAVSSGSHAEQELLS